MKCTRFTISSISRYIASVVIICLTIMSRRMIMTSAYELTGNKVIVGSGMSGLWLARQITDAGQGNDLTVYEKSNVFGGRCATRVSRRSADVKWDTGAQYYSLKSIMNRPHERWSAADMTKPWFKDTKGVPRINSPKGMASLGEQMAGGDISVLQGWKVLRVERMDGEKGSQECPSLGKWKVHFEEQEPVRADTVVLTCPLPQTIDILNLSGLPFDAALSDITYAKAICVLFETNENTEKTTETLKPENNSDFKSVLSARIGVCVRSSGGDESATERTDGFYTTVDSRTDIGVYSLCDQQAKGVSATPAWTVIMNPAFSEQYYEEKDDKVVLSLVTSEIQKVLSDQKDTAGEAAFKFTADSRTQVKRWKFSHPNSIYPKPFLEVSPGLFLAGDSFGGPSITGAVLSADKLSNHLLSREEQT